MKTVLGHGLVDGRATLGIPIVRKPINHDVLRLGSPTTDLYCSKTSIPIRMIMYLVILMATVRLQRLSYDCICEMALPAARWPTCNEAQQYRMWYCGGDDRGEKA